MAEHFQIIADVEAAEDEAPGLAAAIVAWLASDGIIAAEPADCVLGADFGYPPGPRYTTAVTEPVGGLGSWANGVEVCTGRQVFSPLWGVTGPVVCPRCGVTVELEDPATGQLAPDWERFSDALTAWHDGGPAEVACPLCGQATGFNDWHWDTDWPFAVGFLGFTFWNWPQLAEPFIAQVAGRLGHRVVVTSGKF